MGVWNWTAAAAAIFAGLAGLAGGQTIVRISGRVVDPSFATVRNAAVRLKPAAARGSVCPAGTNTMVFFTADDGTFSFPAESRQMYELNVEPPPGLKSAVKTIQVGTGPEFNAGDMVVSIANSSGVEVLRTLLVQGLGGTTATISIGDLAKLPRQTVRTTNGATGTFQGVLLADVFSTVAMPGGEVQMVAGPHGLECRSTAPLYEVLVQARSGGDTAFTWTELDARSAGNAVYLVTERDGEPLPEADGPIELVCGAKWIRQVVAVTIRRAR
jgi:hypothetical protein